MKPKSVEPPRPATWLLEQLSRIFDNQPLTGDLIEAFRQGHSSGWYWRQVLAAIFIALTNLVRRHLASLGYALGCGIAISAAWYFMFSNPQHASAFPKVLALYAKGYPLQWPWSLVYQLAFLTAFQLVPVAPALVAYLVFFRTLQRRHLLGALLLVTVVLAIGNVVSLLIWVIVSPVRGIGWVLISTPPALALLLGMAKASVGREPRSISV